MNSSSAILIRASVGLVMVLYGISQLRRPASWLMYVPEWLEKLLSTRPETFMRSHGAVNVGLGMLFIGGGGVAFVSWATFAWWLSIVPFVAIHDKRTGLRDFAITAAVLAVAVSVSSRR